MEPVIQFLSPIANDQLPRVVVTGHIVDRSGQHRFPSSNIPIVWHTLTFWLEALRSAYGHFHLFSSAVPGVDLLAVTYTLLHPQQTDIYLPQAEEPFLVRSFTGTFSEERWRTLYQTAKVASWTTIHEPVAVQDHTRIYTAHDASVQHYVDLNLHLAGLLRPGTQDTLIAYWDGRDGPPGGTAHLVKHVFQRGIRCWMLCDGLVNADTRYDRLSLRYTFL